MEILGFAIPEALLSFISLITPYVLYTILVLITIRYLVKKKNYSGIINEMKEAPLGISNLLKDGVKRRIIKTLRKQRKYVSAISKEINENAPRTRYHLKQLEKAGLVKSFKLAREAYFSLTKKGNWCLSVINYYYPPTNLHLLVSRVKKILGVFRIKRAPLEKMENKLISNTG